jgi:DNA-binding LacI/PurR family transcriptional regulator
MVTRQRVTIRDIARAAGVSVTAVSYAFNRPGELSSDVRDRILQLAKERGYRPDPRARGLRTGESWLIALVVSNLSNVYFAALASAVQQIIEAQGYSLVVLDCGTKESERRSLEAVRHEHMAGAIVNAYYLPVEELTAAIGERPTVLVLDADTPYAGSCVRVPNFAAGYAATRYLAERGHRHLGHITGRLDVISGLQRRAGYRRALADAGLGPPLEASAGTTYAGGKQAMEQLLTLPTPPDAVFAASDLAALGALTVLRERGIGVPGQIAVMGFDNIEEAERSIPALTTIDHPAREIGATAATLLLATIREPDTHSVVDVTCKLVIRASA